MVTLLLKWFGFNVDGHDRDVCNTCADKTQPVPAMVVMEVVASVVVVDVVAGVAADVVVDDGQSKRLRVDDANHDENGRCKKEPDRDRVRDRDYERSFDCRRSKRERD